tara:strand:- start:3503 stop:4768 length:1266 start_codon:yes stop_codon:yes gene_type:complete
MEINKASYKPTAGMIAEARRGLAWRKEFGRGGTPVGVARARDIINGKQLSESTVKRMYSFFSRHAVDAQAEGFDRGEDGYPSAGRIAHALWGGDAGFSWSKRIRNSLQKGNYDMEEKTIAKAEGAMNHLLMAYAEMMEYRFEGAHELRADTMEIIHALEHAITSGEDGREQIETDYRDDEEDKGYDEEEYRKEIVLEDGQYCVYSADRSRSFGCYISQEKAEERLAQIESFAEKTLQLSTENLMKAHSETGKVLASETLVIVNELIEEELYKRFNSDSMITEPADDFNLTTIIKAEQRYTMGPVYVPDLEDAHGETIDAPELQKAIWDWVRKGDRNIFLQHSDKIAGEMVEILTWPMPIETSLVVPNEGVTKYQFPADTPFMGVIWEEWAWDLVKAGKLRGYSIGGQAQRVEVELPDSLEV